MVRNQSSYYLSSLCRDAFVNLSGATKIEYRDGSRWSAEEDEVEHPLVPRLRAASLQSLVEYPPSLEEIRRQDEAMASSGPSEKLLGAIKSVCENAGAPKDASGDELLGWLHARLFRE
jgi:hypothetical protein